MREKITKITVLFSVVTLIITLTVPAIAGKPPKDPPPPTVKHEIIVSKDGDGDFATITEALDSITQNCQTDPATCPSDTNPYRVTVKPGIYDEAITMLAYVDIFGSGQENTTITYSGNDLPTVAWNSGSSSLENIKVAGQLYRNGTVTIASNSTAIMRDVTIVIATDGCRGVNNNDTNGNLHLYNSKILLSGGTCGTPLGISNGYIFVSGSLIEMDGLDAVGINSVRGGTVENSTIHVTSPDGSWGITGTSNLEIINTKVLVEATTDGVGNIGVEGGFSVKVRNSDITALTTNSTFSDTHGILAVDITIDNSTIKSSVYGITGSGFSVNNSSVSGDISGINKTGGSFQIGGSQIAGGHNGDPLVDKIVNCYDGNYDPIVFP